MSPSSSSTDARLEKLRDCVELHVEEIMRRYPRLNAMLTRSHDPTAAKELLHRDFTHFKRLLMQRKVHATRQEIARAFSALAVKHYSELSSASQMVNVYRALERVYRDIVHEDRGLTEFEHPRFEMKTVSLKPVALANAAREAASSFLQEWQAAPAGLRSLDPREAHELAVQEGASAAVSLIEKYNIGPGGLPRDFQSAVATGIRQGIMKTFPGLAQQVPSTESLARTRFMFGVRMRERLETHELAVRALGATARLPSIAPEQLIAQELKEIRVPEKHVAAFTRVLQDLDALHGKGNAARYVSRIHFFLNAVATTWEKAAVPPDKFQRQMERLCFLIASRTYHPALHHFFREKQAVLEKNILAKFKKETAAGMSFEAVRRKFPHLARAEGYSAALVAALAKLNETRE